MSLILVGGTDQQWTAAVKLPRRSRPLAVGLGGQQATRGNYWWASRQRNTGPCKWVRESEMMRSLCILLCLASSLGKEVSKEVASSPPCTSTDTSCILTVLATRGLIRAEQAARQARAELESGVSRIRGRGRGGEGRYRPDCWAQEHWPRTRGKRGTYETEGEGSSPVVEGNYRTTEGRNGGVLVGQSTAEQTSSGREGRDRGRGRAPCLWEASYYTGDRIPAYQRPAYKPTI